MFSLKLTTLLVLAIFPFAMGVFDPVATFLSGDYDANDLMNSIAMDIRPGEVLHTEKDEIKDVSEDISFWCSNQQRQIPIKTMVDDSSLESKVDLKKPFTFIVHGWIDNGNRTWIKNLTSSYWKFVDTNVCVVDWDRLANYRYDIAAKTNTKIVGNYIAEFIKGLVARKVDLDDVTVVGHSLGGQAAAFTGQALDGKLGTIYGLDPAGPFFTHPIMHYPSERLDSSDAKFVQVIFTTKGFLGASIACGHQNFFPNEGKFLQPGCETPEESFGVKMSKNLNNKKYLNKIN